MAQLPQTFNTADLPDTGGGSVNIPEGQYQAVIIESEFKPTKDNNGQYLQLKIVLTQGQYANTEFIERLNIINQNQQAVEIAYKTLARISEAVGMTQTPSDSVQLHNKPFLIEVKNVLQKDWTNKEGVVVKGTERSEIKKYLPMPKVGIGGGAPAFAQNPAVASNAAPASPPWAK